MGLCGYDRSRAGDQGLVDVYRYLYPHLINGVPTASFFIPPVIVGFSVVFVIYPLQIPIDQNGRFSFDIRNIAT